VVSFGGLISQWGRPTTSVATASFFGILFGILIFTVGCNWLLVKVILIIFRSNLSS
jgi:apolipoprotein N-acyltransferase